MAQEYRFVCHKCKVYTIHSFRGAKIQEENREIFIKFYNKHYCCSDEPYQFDNFSMIDSQHLPNFEGEMDFIDYNEIK